MIPARQEGPRRGGVTKRRVDLADFEAAANVCEVLVQDLTKRAASWLLSIKGLTFIHVAMPLRSVREERVEINRFIFVIRVGNDALTHARGGRGRVQLARELGVFGRAIPDGRVLEVACIRNLLSTFAEAKIPINVAELVHLTRLVEATKDVGYLLHGQRGSGLLAIVMGLGTALLVAVVRATFIARIRLAVNFGLGLRLTRLGRILALWTKVCIVSVGASRNARVRLASV